MLECGDPWVKPLYREQFLVKAVPVPVFLRAVTPDILLREQPVTCPGYYKVPHQAERGEAFFYGKVDVLSAHFTTSVLQLISVMLYLAL